MANGEYFNVSTPDKVAETKIESLKKEELLCFELCPQLNYDCEGVCEVLPENSGKSSMALAR